MGVSRPQATSIGGAVQALEQAEDDVHAAVTVRLPGPRHRDGLDVDPGRGEQEGDGDEVIGRDVGVDQQRAELPRGGWDWGWAGAWNAGEGIPGVTEAQAPIAIRPTSGDAGTSRG